MLIQNHSAMNCCKCSNFTSYVPDASLNCAAFQLKATELVVLVAATDCTRVGVPGEVIVMLLGTVAIGPSPTIVQTATLTLY